MDTVKFLGLRIWFQTILSYLIIAAASIYLLNIWDKETGLNILLMAGLSFTGGVPALIGLSICIAFARRFIKHPKKRVQLFCCFVLLIAVGYGILLIILNDVAGILNNSIEEPYQQMLCVGWVLAGSIITLILQHNKILIVFYHQKIKTQNTMDTNEDYTQAADTLPKASSSNNSIVLKAALVGGLILALLIPMFFLDGLVTERKTRKEETIAEVSSIWAGEQRISNPYLILPYRDTSTTDLKGKTIVITKFLAILPEDNNTSGIIIPDIRKRSIYSIPLYHANLSMNGHFNLSKIEQYVALDKIDFSKAKICLGITEFKGIEETMQIKFNQANYILRPGLPASSVHENGVSAPITLLAAQKNDKLSFTLNLKIKGSVQLMFEPLSGNSNFSLNSTWPSPSFVGNQLPLLPKVTDSGFNATWSFNQANLPFDLILPDKSIAKYISHTGIEGSRGSSDENLAFGVSLIQTVDSYSQTSRCIKYAILIIGLTFSLFFIIEVMQKNAFHPVQYLLAGLALCIFYTLLLSISEYLSFAYAYLIGASATVGLIAYYAYTHFKNIKTSTVFGGFMSLLYAFIYVLLTLEDTALLVGSVALFFILAAVMYITRKVNWYKL